MEKYRRGFSKERVHTEQDLHFAPWRGNEHGFYTLPCLELPGASSGTYSSRICFWGKHPRWEEGLGRVCSTGYWDSSPCSLPASFLPQSLLEQPQGSGTLRQPLLPALQ